MKIRFDSATEEYVRSWGSAASPNEATHLNHEGCPAGTDSKRRLYIKVTDDGKMILAKCHHCGAAGGYRRSRFADLPNSVKKAELGGFVVTEASSTWYRAMSDALDRDFLHISRVSLDKIPAKVLGYFDLLENDGTVAKSTVIKAKLLAAPIFVRKNNPNTLAIVINDDKCVAARIDVRTFEGTGAAKWNRYIRPDVDYDIRTIVFNESHSNVAVICEDLISAMKLSFAGYAGVALSGTDIRDDPLLKLAVAYDTIIVWLDNDSKLVLDKSNALVGRFRLISDRVSQVCDYADPKNIPLDKIQEIVQRQILELQSD